MTPTQPNDWKQRFDSRFLTKSNIAGDPAIEYVNSPNIIQDTTELKLFIEQEISAAEARGREGMRATGETSDGYHTFNELYDHRVTLFIALCRMLTYISVDPWRSKFHHDGSSFDGWFIMGFGIEPGKQITYHLPLSRWDETDFAETLERAPEWDGHTSGDVLERLKNLTSPTQGSSNKPN